MLDTIDTRMISLDEPISEGAVKILDESAPWDTDLSKETSDVASLREGESSLPLKPTYVPDRLPNFYEWLGFALARVSRKALIDDFATAQFNLAKLSSDLLWTDAFDPHAIFEAISEEKSPVVSVSPGLIMPRSEVHASSLLAPSGAYLTWLEMLAEEAHAQSQ